MAAAAWFSRCPKSPRDEPAGLLVEGRQAPRAFAGAVGEIDGDIGCSREPEHPANVIAVLVRHQDGAQAAQRQLQAGQPPGNFLERKAAIDQQEPVVPRQAHHQRIAFAAASQAGESHCYFISS